MLYAALVYLILVFLCTIIMNNNEFIESVVKKMEDENPDVFSVIDAMALYKKLHVILVLVSPLLLCWGIVSAIYGAICNDTGNTG